MEWQVTNQELSKKLKELGVPQESAFYWVLMPSAAKGVLGQLGLIFKGYLEEPRYSRMMEKVASAFTCSELGALLPPRPYILPAKQEDGWGGNWYLRIDGKDIEEKTEADARAKMLIHLIETGILNPKADER